MADAPGAAMAETGRGLSEYQQRAALSMGNMDRCIAACDMFLARAIASRKILARAHNEGDESVGEKYQEVCATITQLQAMRSRFQSLQAKIDSTNNANAGQRAGE